MGEGTVVIEDAAATVKGKGVYVKTESYMEGVSYISLPCLMWKPAGDGCRGQPSRTYHFSRMHEVALIGWGEGPSCVHAS